MDWEIPAIVGSFAICLAAFLGGLAIIVHVSDSDDRQAMQICVSHGMQWHDQTNDCTKG